MGGGASDAEALGSARGGPNLRLLERDDELAALADALAEVSRGRGAVAAIEGEPGIGKSELLAAARALAEENSMDSHLVRTAPTERTFPYGLVRELVGSVGREPASEEPSAAVASELAPLLDPRREAPPAELVVAGGLWRLVQALAAECPLLIAVDDLHWGDVPSLRVLLYVARRIEAVPAALCVTARAMSEDDAAAPLVDELLAETADPVLHPAPLSLAAVTAIVAEALADEAEPGFSAACHDATGGNPLLLRELLRGLAAEGVEPNAGHLESIASVGGRAVSRTVRMRLAQLPQSATALVRAAAILGDGTPVVEAARVAGLEAEIAFDAAAELERLEVLTGADLASFVHPLVREAVLSDLSPGEAADLHESAAELLAETGASPERVAGHLLYSTPRGSTETVRTLRAAAGAASARGDRLAAAPLLARALEEPAPEEDRAEILLDLVMAERHSDAAAARGHAAAALELISDPEERAVAALELASLLPATDPHGAVRTVEPHLDRLRDAEARLRARSVMLTGALLAPDLLPLARELAEELRVEAKSERTAARMAASLVGYSDALRNEPAHQVIELIEPAIAAPLEDPRILGQLCIGMIALVAADSPVALAASEEWNAIANELGYAGPAAAALMCRTHALLASGRVRESVAAGREAIEIAELFVGGSPVSWTAAALVEALIETGDLDEAGRVASRILPAAIPESTLDLHGLLAVQARLAAVRADRERALERTLALGRLCGDGGILNPALVPWRSRAALLIVESSEDGSRARELAAEEVALARDWGAPRALGRALTALAVVSKEDATELHEEAVAVLEGSPALLELARAMLEFGVALRESGEPEAARERLRRAAELAEECGAAPLAARARDQLVAAGARPRRAALSGPASLTRQERRVAAIAAAGLSNQEIAERLHLSLSTIESHLSNAYRKLGISSRSQLSSVLG